MKISEGPDTVVEMLLSAAHSSPDECAVSFEGRKLNYREYWNCVCSFSSELQKYDVAGNRVAILFKNSLDMAIVYFSVHASGAQIVPLNPEYTERELVEILIDAEPVLIIFEDEFTDLTNRVINQIMKIEAISIGPSTWKLDIWKNNNTGKFDKLVPEPDQLATLQYTGGTSGVPKGVNITHRQITTNLKQLQTILPMNQDTEVILCVMPIHHIFASFMCLHTSVFITANLVIQRRYHPKNLLDAIVSEQVTLLPAGPTVFNSLLNFEKFYDTDFSNMRLAYSGSAPLSEDILIKWKKYTGTEILEGYGQSEAGPLLTSNTLDKRIVPRSVGRPLPLTEIEIVDTEDGNKVLDTGCEGEIRARGPQIMLGYRNREEETKKALRNGWLYTGDIGKLDENGILYITDRKKDMVIVSGYNVFPREVDEVLFGHQNVKEAATVGVPDTYRGEVIHAFVVLERTQSDSVKQLLEYCKSRLANYKIPSTFHVVEEILKTTVGKIDKVGLRELAKESSNTIRPLH